MKCHSLQRDALLLYKFCSSVLLVWMSWKLYTAFDVQTGRAGLHHAVIV
jgi:hypothetical protein